MDAGLVTEPFIDESDFQRREDERVPATTDPPPLVSLPIAKTPDLPICDAQDVRIPVGRAGLGAVA